MGWPMTKSRLARRLDTLVLAGAGEGQGKSDQQRQGQKVAKVRERDSCRLEDNPNQGIRREPSPLLARNAAAEGG